MDTKVTYTTPEQIKQRGAMALDLMDQFKPDTVFVNDDDALKWVGIEYTQRCPERRLPFVFSDINVDPTIYRPINGLDRPGGPLTGALERFPCYEAFSLAKRISPGAARIILLADSSTVSSYVVNAFKAEFLDRVAVPPLQVTGPIQIKTFAEWKDNVAECRTKADFIGIITYHQLTDESGGLVTAPEVVDWTVHHSKLPEIGFLTFHAEDGFLAAAGVSGHRTGIYVGLVGGEIFGGRDAGTVPIVDPGVVDTTFNVTRAKQLGITIPARELEGAAGVFQYTGKTRY